MGNWCWSWYNVCMSPELDSSRKCCIFFRARKTRYRKWEKEKHSRGCLISFSPPATRDQVGWLLWGELVGFCITWPWVEEYIVYRLVTQVPHWHFPSVQWLPGGELWVMWKTKWVIQLPSEEIFCILKLNLSGRSSNAGNKTGGCPNARSPGEYQHQHQVWIYLWHFYATQIVTSELYKDF